jgi:uncharacterized protein (TIGR04255 family)
MDEQIHHRQAPITEAVLDIQVELAEDVPLEALARIGAAVNDQYPERRDRMKLEGEWSVGPEMAMKSKQTQLGYIFVSTDNLQTFQARLDGFTFSRFRPYTDWEQYSSDARKLWEIYRKMVPVKMITRIAVRYINRLDLPPVNGYIDFSDYLRTVPEVSRDLPQGLSGYFMQVQIPLEEVSGIVIINEGLLEPPSPDIVSILLDIDLFRTFGVPQEEGALWETFDQLRVMKNRIFEACITENTRRLID